jgi:arylformamidase
MASTNAHGLATPTPTPPHKGEGKGELVWRDLDQKALDDAYDQDVYAPNRPLIVARRLAAAERARAMLGQPERVAYGPSEYEQLDIFRAPSQPSPASGGGKNGLTSGGGKGGGAPINVFVHGGAWRRNKGPDYAALAEPLVNAGAHCVILDFINVEQANGDLMPMYQQVRRAIAWCWRNADKFGGDRERLYISAHSSGSHLSACVLTEGWREEGLPENFCKGALLLSGMYDLEAVALSKRSSYVKFTDAMVETLSSQRHLAGLHTPLILAYGSEETPEFQRQSKEYFAAVRALGKPAELIVGEAYNHFELLETLANPYGLTGRAMLRQMDLA